MREHLLDGDAKRTGMTDGTPPMHAGTARQIHRQNVMAAPVI